MPTHDTQKPAPQLFMIVARVGEKARANIETVRSLLASERRHTAQLLREGRIASAYLDLAGSTVFLIVPESSDDSVRLILATFPLYDYLDWDLYPVREGIPDGA